MFAEIDILFERGVSARKFRSTPVDVFATRAPEKVDPETVHKKGDNGARTTVQRRVFID